MFSKNIFFSELADSVLVNIHNIIIKLIYFDSGL